MQPNLKVLKKGRVYSQEFKQQLVNDFESVKFCVPQVEKRYGISNPTIYSWIHKLVTDLTGFSNL